MSVRVLGHVMFVLQTEVLCLGSSWEPGNSIHAVALLASLLQNPLNHLGK